jgi:hypothetical protein
MHAKGLCAGCYNSVFHIDKVKEANYRKSHEISLELYKKITEKCKACGFDKIVDLHHLNKDKKDNSEENMIGLCPNCHKMLHDRRFNGEIVKILKEKGFKIEPYFKPDESFK